MRAAGELGVQNVLEREKRSVVDECNQIAFGILESARVEKVLHYESGEESVTTVFVLFW